MGYYQFTILQFNFIKAHSLFNEYWIELRIAGSCVQRVLSVWSASYILHSFDRLFTVVSLKYFPSVEIGAVAIAGNIRCFVYMKANCNVSATRLKIQASVSACAKYFLLTEVDGLPANGSISIDAFREGSKKVVLSYKYEICVKNQGEMDIVLT